MPHLASEKQCTGCLACIDACKHQAIFKILKNEHPYVKIDTDKCISCGLCEKTCPIVSPIGCNSVENMNVYGGWAIDKILRINAASGGAFSALAQSFFRIHKNEKVAVFGATLENNRVKHISIESEEDIYRLANSKYIQSNTQGIYNEVIEKLRDGYWIMFSGCPCQIAALYGCLGKKKNVGHLITVEVVCHGIASNEALDLHLKYYHSNKIYSFRDKKNNSQEWKYSQTTTIDIKKEKVKLKREKDIFYSIYSSWLLDRRSCSNCHFAMINRVADITLADFWGLSHPEYYEQGVSLIIANNDKAQLLIQQADTIYIFKESLKIAIEGNPNLYTGYKFIQWHPIVLWPDFFRKILPKKIRLNILVNKFPYKLFWACYKLPTIFLTKHRKKQLIKRLYTNIKTRQLINL